MGRKLFTRQWKQDRFPSADSSHSGDGHVALTVLIRATVVSAVRRVAEGDQLPEVCSELLRAAYWRAARDGWTGSSIDVLTGTLLPFAD
ncbi:hypothetical protein [Streptomyces sp. NPDC023327]|uniref:hypothetical protein n=1 Tax=Streptomyces sp. NPDC023327 TaxID=3157088 RepID=UPI0033E2C3A8